MSLSQALTLTTTSSVMSPPGSPRLVDSFTAPKEVLQEFAELAEEENYDPFAETASKRQIAARQSDYHNRRFNRQANESADVFKVTEDGMDVDGRYKEAMRVQRLEKEEGEDRRWKERWDGQVSWEKREPRFTFFFPPVQSLPLPLFFFSSSCL